MNIGSTTLEIKTYKILAYFHKHHHLASLGALPARTKLYAGGREGVFSETININKMIGSPE